MRCEPIARAVTPHTQQRHTRSNVHTVRRTQYVGAPYEDARGLPHSTQPVTLGLRRGWRGVRVG